MSVKTRASLINYAFSLSTVLFAVVNGILLVPLYLKYIETDHYGIWLSGVNLIGMIGIIEGGLSTILTQKLSEAWSRKDDQAFRELSYANFLVSFVIGGTIILFGGLFSFVVPAFYEIPDAQVGSFRLAFVLLSFSSGFTFLSSQFGVFPQVFQRTMVPGFNNLLSVLLSFITIYLMLVNGFGIIALASGLFVRGFVYMAGNLVYFGILWKKESLSAPHRNNTVVIGLLRETIFPFLSKISNTIVNNSQNLIIGVFFGGTATVIYEFTGKIMTTLRMFVNIIAGSTFASLSLTFAGSDDEKRNRSFLLVNKTHYYLLFLISILTFMFTAPILKFWVGIEFFGGNWLLVLLIISAIVQERKSFYFMVMNMLGKFERSAKQDMLNSVVFLALLYLFSLTPTGYYSIPFSIILSSSVSLIYYQIYINKHERLTVFISLNQFVQMALIALVPVAIVLLFSTVELSLPALILCLGIAGLYIVTCISLFNRDFFLEMKSKFIRARS